VNKAKKLDELVGSVEDLLARLPAKLSPEIAALRDKVDDGIFEAWTSVSNQRIKAQRSARRAVPSVTPALLAFTVIVALSAKLLIDRRNQPGTR
jgi:hypothetical protein